MTTSLCTHNYQLNLLYITNFHEPLQKNYWKELFFMI